MRDDNLARRSVAALLDLFIFGVFVWLAFRYLGRVVQRGEMTVHVISGLPALLIPLVWFFYYPYTEHCLHRTLGKFICGLVVVSARRGELTLGQACLRRLLDPVEIWFAFGLIGWIIVAASQDGRRLGDRLAEANVARSTALQPGTSPNGGPPLHASSVRGEPPSVS